MPADVLPRQKILWTDPSKMKRDDIKILFDHLLERSRKRNAGENGFGNFGGLPTLQLGLGDIARKVRNLGQGGPSADQAQDRTA